MDITSIEKHLFQGKPLAGPLPALARLNPVHVGQWLAQKALSDPRLKIQLPLETQDRSGTVQLLHVLNAARPRLSCAEFDAVAAMLQWVPAAPLLEQVPFHPQVSLHGAVTFRWGRSCFALERDAQMCLRMSSGALLRELGEIHADLQSGADEDGYSIIHRDFAGVSWSQELPREFSEVGQTLVVLGSQALTELEGATDYEHLLLVQEAPELLELLEQSEGPLVLRIFGDRVLVHVLYALPSQNASNLHRFSYGLGLDEDPMELDMLAVPDLLTERLMDEVPLLVEWDTVLRGLDERFATFVRADLLLPAIETLCREHFTLEPVFAISPLDPVGYDASARHLLTQDLLNRPVAALSFPPELLLTEGKTPAQWLGAIRTLVERYIPRGTAMNAYLLLSNRAGNALPPDLDDMAMLQDRDAFGLLKTVMEVLYAHQAKVARDHIDSLLPGQPPSLQELAKESLGQFAVLFERSDEQGPEELLALAKHVSKDLSTLFEDRELAQVELAVPTWGLMQGLQDGELTDGNASRLMVL